jgi:hypothetical protein
MLTKDKAERHVKNYHAIEIMNNFYCNLLCSDLFEFAFDHSVCATHDVQSQRHAEGKEQEGSEAIRKQEG